MDGQPTFLGVDREALARVTGGWLPELLGRFGRSLFRRGASETVAPAVEIRPWIPSRALGEEDLAAGERIFGSRNEFLAQRSALRARILGAQDK
jgi:hypothetical protein